MPPEILQPIIILGALGLLFGIVLSVSAKVFHVEVDPRIEQVEDILPGINCGGCGYPGCSGYATAVVAGGVAPNLCVADPSAAEKIGALMGMEVEEKIPMLAVVRCRGDVSLDNYKYEYLGDMTCAEAVLVAEGPNPCRYGCLGMGTCVDSCPFDAMHMRDGLPSEVDPEKCVACGNCVSACPKNLIELVPSDRKTIVLCCSHDRGKSAKDMCKIACIGCGKCAKKCPEDAIELVNNLPVIDYEKCTACGICAEACPQNTILFKGEKPVVSTTDKK